MIRRRQFLQLGAAALAMPSVARAQAVKGQITLMAYTGIFQDNYTATVVEPFQKAFPDVKVNYTPGGTSAAMLGNIRAQKADPQVDVVIMDVTTSSIGNAESLFDKITPAEAPSLTELYPDARAVGGEFGPAVTYDHLVLIYDTQTVTPPLAKLSDLWRDDLKGFLSISAPPNIQGLALTCMVEKMEGGDFRTSIDKAVKKLKELSPGVKTFEPNPDGATLLLNGVVKVATGWNARSQLYRDESKGRIGVLQPPEGSVFQINTINMTAGSKNRAAATAFVNYALSQPAQKAFSERLFYAPTNAKAQIDAAALGRTAASPDYRAKMIPVDWMEIVKMRDQWNNRWRREIIAAK